MKNAYFILYSRKKTMKLLISYENLGASHLVQTAIHTLYKAVLLNKCKQTLYTEFY